MLIINNIKYKIMRKVIVTFITLIALVLTVNGQDWKQGDNNSNGYWMGPGMMWDSASNGYGYGPGMMGGYWMDNGWHQYGNKNINLSNEQKTKWDQVAQQGSQNAKISTDSLNYYVRQVQRLQREKSNQVNSDLERIKGILTPEQYTQFLEKLVTGNPN